MNQRVIKNQLDRQTVHSTSRTQELDKQTQWLADNQFKKNVYFKDTVNAFSQQLLVGKGWCIYTSFSHFTLF